MARKTLVAKRLAVTFWGAARTVTGSMHVVEVAGQRILLDCGLFQGRRSEARAHNSRFPFRPKNVDAVILSHAHVDHCGNLPSLIRGGFTGDIYCTPATRALASVMLGDAAKIQQEDAAYLNRHRGRGEPTVEPLYDGRDVYLTLRRFRAVPYGKPFAVGRRLEATFHDAGHLLGSAMVSLRADLGPRETSLTFTGDLGRPGQPILRDPDPVPPGELLICESTYGGHTHEPVNLLADRLGAVVRRVIERGGKVLIPAFSLGRTQTVVYFLHQLMSDGRLPVLPVFVDSPLAVRATEVFHAHPECFDDEVLRLMETDPDVFGESRVRYVDKQHESIALNDRRDPCVIISAGGMCEGGRILHHLKHNLEDPRSAVLIVCYQAADTLGRRLVEGRPEVRILGRSVAVKAEIEVLNGFSSHADHGDFLRALSPLADSTRATRLVHGEPERAEALAEALRERGFADVAVPDRGDEFTIE